MAVTKEGIVVKPEVCLLRRFACGKKPKGCVKAVAEQGARSLHCCFDSVGPIHFREALDDDGTYGFACCSLRQGPPSVKC